MRNRAPLAVIASLVLCAGTQNLLAQRDRIAAQVNRSNTVKLTGHVHPAATAANDRGRADAAMPMPNMTLMMSPSAAQQTALEALLASQQDPTSADYHHWLTPEEYGDRFGLSSADLAKVTSWLEGEGFTVISTARGRNNVVFSGTAAITEKALHTEMHRYMVRGQMHYANSTEPSIPAALAGVIGSIRGLNDFKPRARRAKLLPHDNTSSGVHQLAPDDVATIYDIKSLYTQNITGAGQSVIIVGQVQIDPNDISAFRAKYNLPASTTKLVPVPNLPLPPQGSADSGDLGESDLDIETAGAVARGATVIFVYSNNVDDATTYAINQNLAPVLSSSYGLCEAETGQSYASTQRSLAQQANAQGMTWVTAAGDSGAVDCYSDTERTSPGLGVDEPGTIPEVTSVGGTEFVEGSGSYWASKNDANSASALSYIPETTWNDSVADGSPSASGGGASMYFAKPSWQSGTGVPNDSVRDVPDVSFSASADHDGYLIYTGGALYVYGGTSVAAPLLGGILTLLNQYQVVNGYQKTAGLGNINPKLYSLAATSPGAFHDITTGNNAVDPCGPKAKNCVATPIGFNSGTGYDQATGLGSLDVFNFFTAWNGTVVAAPRLSSNMTLSATLTTVSQSGSTVLTATVAGSGVAPTGTVAWTYGNIQLGSATLAAGKASLTVQGSAFTTGTATVSATYGGDTIYTGASGTQTLTVTSKPTPTLTLSSAPATITQSGSTVLSAVVAGSGTAPTGSVTWTNGATTLGAATLSGGKASLTVQGTSFSAGTTTITAVYSGDTNYSTASNTQTLTVTATSATPVITSSAAVVSGASFQAGVSANSWVTIFGTNLSATTDTWSNSIVNGVLPTKLDGVSVSINGQPAYVSFVSSGQINVLAPNIGTGQVTVTVTTASGPSAPVTVTSQALQPAFFPQSGNYALATSTSYSVLGTPTAPAQPGQTIILWGAGFGATSPAAPVGTVTPANGTLYTTANTVSVTVGGVAAAVYNNVAALTPTAAGLYEVIITVPSSLANGNYPVVATIGGVQSPATTMLTVHN